MTLLGLISGFQSGAYNMALDEYLLEKLREQTEPGLVIRTYQWTRPTLSLGVHQPRRDMAALASQYPQDYDHNAPERVVYEWIRRPTGGRAILHGEDIAFSFITNDPALLKLPLSESYCHFSKLLKEALRQCGVPLQESCEESDRAYLRSSLCFETHTPSDLLDARGQKLAGSAQLRRQGGLLQHGSAFVSAYDISQQQLAEALFKIFGAHYRQPVAMLELTPSDEATLAGLVANYQREGASFSQSILDNTATTSGSHLEPASL